jgi:PAS domain S-box-containing protein
MTGAGIQGALGGERGEPGSPVNPNDAGGRALESTPRKGVLSRTLLALINRLGGGRLPGSAHPSTILSSISEGVVVYDRELRAQIWNPFMERLTGLPASEVLGRSFLDVFPELSAEGVPELLARSMEGESVTTADTRFRIPGTGREGWVTVRYDPFRNQLGEIVGVVAIIQDISERKRTERALETSERLLAVHAEIADVFLTVDDQEVYERVMTVVLEAFDSRHGLFGYIDGDGNLVCPSLTREIFQQCQMSDKSIIFPPESWGGIWGESLKTRNAILSNVPGNVPEGHIEIERCIFVPIVDRAELIGLLGVANRTTDYTDADRELLESIVRRIGPILHARLARDREERDRLRAEEEVRASERRYRAVVDKQTELVERFQPDGTVTFANDAMCRFFKITRRDLIGTRFHPVMTDEDREAAEGHLAGLSRRNPVGVIKIPCLAPDGSRRWISWTNQAMFDDDGNITEYQAVGRDITDEVHATEDLKRVLAEKDALLREVHHRVKNNMAVISSLISLQSDQHSGQDAEEALGKVRGRIRAMALVHEQIYRSGDFRRIDLGEYAESLVGSLLQTRSDLVGRVDLQTEMAGVTVALDLAIPCGLILNELIGNSLEHGFPGTDTGKIVASLNAGEDGWVELRVKDDGIGIRSDVDDAADAGFGLQLVDLLTKQLGGEIEVSSTDGVDVKVRFPLEDQ